MDKNKETIPKKVKKWNSQRTGFQQSLKYLQGRMTGQIKSLRTPWAKFNDATTDGIEWNTLTVIGGRPASGKTLIAEQIVRESFALNLGENFRVLQFQFEMLARTSAIREYSSIIGKPYKYLCSADGKLSEADLQKCYDYAKAKVKYPIDVVETPCTVDEFKEIIRDYMLEHAVYDSEGNMIFTKVLITIDHSLLFKKAPYEKDKQDMLNNLGEAITLLKRMYPISFILLSQLNRNIDNPERSEDGKYGNYILESDLFGSDALLQHADTVIGINRPAKQKIRFYGPDRYVIEDDRVLVLHFLKCRNGDTRLSFFRAEFERMMITEMMTPPQQEKRLSTK